MSAAIDRFLGRGRRLDVDRVVSTVRRLRDEVHVDAADENAIDERRQILLHHIIQQGLRFGAGTFNVVGTRLRRELVEGFKGF